MILVKTESKTILLQVLVLVVTCLCLSCMYFATNNVASAETKKERIESFKQRQLNIENIRKNTQIKIRSLKSQEYKAINKLKSTQHKLAKAKVYLKDQQYNLSLSKVKLDELEKELLKLSKDQKDLKQKAANRIRKIYKGEQLSLLHMVLSAKDITTFLDRLYYKQKIIQKDKMILQNLRQKTIEVTETKNSLKTEKNRIISSINNIQNRKKEISMAIRVNKDLVHKLKTNRAAFEAAENQLARESKSLESQITRLTAGSKATVSYTRGGFIKPVNGPITSRYGWRRHPIFGGKKFHTGVDIAGRNKSAIKASNNGKVIYTGWYGGYGKVVIIDHGKKGGTSTTTLYAHLSSINVRKGQSIKKGQKIGTEGSTGYSTGPHLHFEVRKNGKHTNPFSYIR